MPDSSAGTPGPTLAKKPQWAPRIWQGCSFYAWMRLLVNNRFAVHWSRLYIAVIVTVFSAMHSVLAWVQMLTHGLALRRTQLKAPPIFIVGHWRSGTTWLHEMFVQDPQFAYPTYYECHDPNHFLLTEGLFTRLFWFLCPKERPMDNMKVGWDRPQEDEFAMCMLGQPSPYNSIAFPNRPQQDQEWLDFKGVAPRKLERWKRTLHWFLRCITYKTGKRIVLKSPPHTARIDVLKEMFPGAIFVHVVRDPRVVFSSTVNLWRTLFAVQGMQVPNYEGIEERVFETFTRLYQRFEESKRTLPAEQLYEVRYEDVVRDPAAAMRCIYEHFGLGGWNAMQPRLEEFLAGLRGYETNKYRLDPRQLEEVERRWGDVIRRYGYEMTAETPSKESTAKEREAVAAAN